MTTLDLAHNQVKGGFFVHNGHHPQPYQWPEAGDNSYQIVGTYKDSGTPVRDRLISMIRAAKEQVFIASFMLGDKEVIKEMLEAADRLKGGVYVITALDEKSLRRGLQEYEEDEQAAPEERRKYFEQLTAGGIYVRGHEKCHAKFAVIDRTAALVGSANFVAKAFDFTGELNVLVREPSQVQQARRLFVQIWYEGCNWEVPPGTTYTVAERKPKPAPMRPNDHDLSDNRLVWTNGSTETNLLAAIREVIDASQRELLLSTYSIIGMSQNPTLVMEPLTRAINRGVAAKLLIRQRNAYPSQMEDLLALNELGVEIYGDVRNHAKAVVADRRLAAVFSANFDGAHGLNSGVEAGIRLGDPKAVASIARYLDHAMSNGDTTFLKNPTLADLDGKLAARWVTRWPHNEAIYVAFSEPLLEALKPTGKPILYEQASDGILTVYAGSLALRLDTHAVTPANPSVTQRLKNWLQSSRCGEMSTSKRGFCPAKIVFTT